MRFPILLVAAILIATLSFPGVANAATTQYVIITANPGNITGCPGNFTITEASEYEFELGWIPDDGANTTGVTIRGAYGRDVANATDGFDVYTGNGTSTVHWINTEFIGVDVYYRLYSTFIDGSYSACYASGTLVGGEGVTNIATIFIFLVPFPFAALGMWANRERRETSLMVVAGILWMCIAMYFLALRSEAAELYNIFGYVSIALGFIFGSAPLWAKNKLEEIEDGIKDQDDQRSHGDKIKDWEKERGLRSYRR